MTEKLIILTKKEELVQIDEYLKDKQYVAYDTETTGVGKDAQIIGFSISGDTETGYYVITKYWDKDKKELITSLSTEDILPIMQLLKTKSLIMHNAVFDLRMTLDNYGVSFNDALHTDTWILGQLLDENRHNGLKELGISIFGEDADLEKRQMVASIKANGGKITKTEYDLYKADADLIARYGAKDAILTIKLFYHLVPILVETGLDSFFYTEESMPLCKTANFDLNYYGLRVDAQRLIQLEKTLEAECLELKSLILKDVQAHVKDKYPGTTKSNKFNIGSNQQIAWLLFSVLKQPFGTLTDSGKEVCKSFNMKLPYDDSAKREFIYECERTLGREYAPSSYNKKTKKMGNAKKVQNFWKYLCADKNVLSLYSKKYNWVKNLLEYDKKDKLLGTYVKGIQKRMRYNIIYPGFLQARARTGRYSSTNPNFQNLPRDDKRIKECIVSRPGKVFVGADYSQLEPRIFTSLANDPILIKGFEDGDDFYSVVGNEVFGTNCNKLKKDEDDPESFISKYPSERYISKSIALGIPYGEQAFKLAKQLKIPTEKAQEVINNYLDKYSSVHQYMLNCHELVKEQGEIKSIFGRVRRLPLAKAIKKMYGDTPHSDLPYLERLQLNSAMNFTVQGVAASIVNRAMVALCNSFKEHKIDGAYIVMQVHDEIIVECDENDGKLVAMLMKQAMEHTNELPNVALIAEPKIGKTLAELK